MGESNVSSIQEANQAQAFLRALLSDLRALEILLDTGAIESGVRRELPAVTWAARSEGADLVVVITRSFDVWVWTASRAGRSSTSCATASASRRRFASGARTSLVDRAANPNRAAQPIPRR